MNYRAFLGFGSILAGLALMTSLTVPAYGQYTAASTKSILTQNDGLPCDPQHGSDKGYYQSGCCGSPGNRECAYVLHFGKGPLGRLCGVHRPHEQYSALELLRQ